MCRKSRFADEIGERYAEIEYSGGKVLQWWPGLAGNVRLSHLLKSFLFYVWNQKYAKKLSKYQYLQDKNSNLTRSCSRRYALDYVVCWKPSCSCLQSVDRPVLHLYTKLCANIFTLYGYINHISILLRPPFAILDLLVKVVVHYKA